MATTSRLDLPAPETAPLVPRELWLVYPVAPLAAALLLVDDFLQLPLHQQWLKVASISIPFAAMALTLHPLYAWVMPRLVARVPSRLARGLLHLLLIGGGTLAVSLLVRPLHNQVCGKDLPADQFAVACLLISAVIFLPAMAVQAQRNRASSIERLAQAQRRAALEAQLEALQARTNPHFFFNSLNTVASLIADDPQLAERTLERLADLFRYALDSAEVRRVPLAREFEMVADYLAIQQARFGDRLRTAVLLDPSLASFEVPPLLLQPLVENAILHGLADRKAGRVEVEARREGDRVVIEVRDDGPGPGASEHRGTRTSVRDLGDRLRLAFGDQGRFALEAAPGGGCLARLALPAPP